jgi:hypothetical protein
MMTLLLLVPAFIRVGESGLRFGVLLFTCAAFAGAVTVGWIAFALAGTALRATLAVLATLAFALIFRRHDLILLYAPIFRVLGDMFIHSQNT